MGISTSASFLGFVLFSCFFKKNGEKRFVSFHVESITALRANVPREFTSKP